MAELKKNEVERSSLGKAWHWAKGSPFKAALFAGLASATIYQGAVAIMATDGTPLHIFHYMGQNTKADLRYILTGDFLNNRDRAAKVVICQPAHYNPDTHQEVAPPPHLATLYSQMEDNLVQQIESRRGYLYNDIHIALTHYKSPLVVIYKEDVIRNHDYNYKVLGMYGSEYQDCSKLTPRQSEGIVKRERGSISTRHFDF